MALATPAHGFAFKKDLTDLAVFQKVGTAQKRRFPRARRSDQRNDVTSWCDQINAFQNLEFAVTLVQVADFDDGRVGHLEGFLWAVGPVCRRKDPSAMPSVVQIRAGIGWSR